jgi:hypothetical protein
MKIIVQESSGRHNADLTKTRGRLLQGGSWKKQRVVEIVPAADTIAAEVYYNHRQLYYPPNNGIYRMLALGDEVGIAYSNAIEWVLENPELSKWEYILTLEHDNGPPADGVIRLIERMEQHPEYSCIGGLYFTKGEGGVAQIWGDIKDPCVNFRPQLPDPAGGLVECYGTGMGFNLFRLAMFKDSRLRKPWFKTEKHNGVATQDLYAWGDFRKYGYRCAIDCSVKVGHFDSNTKTWW